MKPIKFKAKEWKITKPRPVFLVGQIPGVQREGHKNRIVFEGNRTGDFITYQILPNVSYVYLTNISNYYTYGTFIKKYIDKGLNELKADLKFYNPSKVITLGNFAYNHFKIKRWTNLFNVVLLPHPSHILRFNKDINEYKKLLINEINTTDLRSKDADGK